MYSPFPIASHRRNFAKKDMKAATKNKLCNKSLGVVLVLMLASGIQLEATGGKHEWSVWVHIAAGIVLCILSCYHIYLHYRTGNWFSRFAKNRNVATRILWWTFLLTAISGIAVTAVWIADGFVHSPLGGVHGKIGFLMVIVAIAHVARNIKPHSTNIRAGSN